MRQFNAPDLRDRLPARVPLWREPLALIEWSALRWSPTFWGLGLPRGRGEPVVVIPGFLGSDPYLADLRQWLRRAGYRPYASGIGRNADCLDRLADRLDQTIDRAALECGQRVHLIGHSLGGVLARGVATRRPGPIASVCTLGSPLRGLRSHPATLRAGERVRRQIQVMQDDGPADPDCYTGYCSCSFVRALRSGAFPDDVPDLAIYTRTDGVVDWRFTRLPDASRNREVLGTHCGLAFNPQAYRHIAAFLAAASRTERGERDDLDRSREEAA
ncbi:MAG: hypothetical protein DWQ36_11685 [Acidobacteria bacterium]|nr:MAG: hypothetical protein DWQ30_18005 [Acidobacteriota bacterium]REK07641.1 MAG: hypothetical protein DWQ36_11685 [Acidobacteriota bacterium]